MKRTKFPDNGKGLQTLTGKDLKIFSELLGRAQFASRFGQHFGGERNIFDVLGYVNEVTYELCAAQYKRQDIATAIINRPVSATWRGDFELVESDDDEETKLEKEMAKLIDELSLQSVFARLDRLSGIGRYGVLLLGLDDVSDTEGFKEEVRSGQHKLLYVKPLDEGSAKIVDWEKNTRNERYGLPTQYDITVTLPGGDAVAQIKVHHSRIVHIPAGTLLKSEIYGVPRLEPVFNRLKDLEKLVGASAEMFWKGARPGYQGIVDKDAHITAEQEAGLRDELDEFEHNLRRVFVNQGIEWKALAAQVSDPTAHVDVQIQMISAETGIPKRILTGSERGELASTEDKTSWLETVDSRRHEYAEPVIVRPFVDRMGKFGILPEPKESYSIQWSDLWAPSEKEKVDIGKVRATALKDYGAAGPGQEVLPPDAFLEFGLGFTKEQIEIINEMREAAVLEEEAEAAETERLAEEERATREAGVTEQVPEEEEEE